MMKLLMFSVRDDEQQAIREWAAAHDATVDTNELELDAETVKLVESYDGLVIQQRNRMSDPHIYQALNAYGIKQLTTRTAGYDMIDLDQATANGLVVTNVPAYSPNSVAELAVTQTMRLIRNLPQFEAREAAQDFRWSGLMAREIRSLTVGVIGAGRIGGTVARLFKGLGATIIANDIVERDDLRDVLTYVSKQELLTRADIVTLHVPLLPSTERLVDAAALALMKPDACLINASRGPVVDTEALIAALENKQIAGAALDTLVGEEHFFNLDLRGKRIPSEALEKLRAMTNVLITPHIGFYTNLAVKNMVEISLNDVLSVLAKGTSPHQVNAVITNEG